MHMIFHVRVYSYMYNVQKDVMCVFSLGEMYSCTYTYSISACVMCIPCAGGSSKKTHMFSVKLKGTCKDVCVYTLYMLQCTCIYVHVHVQFIHTCTLYHSSQLMSSPL